MAEFQTLELNPKRTFCFGFSPFKSKNGRPGRGNWFGVASRSDADGWDGVDVSALQKDFAENVEKTYLSLAGSEIRDLDSGMTYKLAFDNDSTLWKAGIVDSPDAELLPEQAKAFFSSEYVKKFATRCWIYARRAAKCVRKTLEPKMNRGEMLFVSEKKLERIMELCENAHVMDNFREGKYYFV